MFSVKLDQGWRIIQDAENAAKGGTRQGRKRILKEGLSDCVLVGTPDLRKEIHALGLEYVVGRIESVTRASYYPNSGKITVKALAEKGRTRIFPQTFLRRITHIV